MSGYIIDCKGLGLVVDKGRFGYRNIGVSYGGAFDKELYFYANQLLDNDQYSQAIEFTNGIIRIRFKEQTAIAICGISAAAYINENRIYNWRSIKVNSNDILTLNAIEAGSRNYIAIKDGFQFAGQLGSASCVLRDKLGFKKDRYLLQTGDNLPYNKTNLDNFNAKKLKNNIYIEQSEPLILNLIENESVYSGLKENSKQTIYRSIYEIDSNSDRVGLRLNGNKIEFKEKNTIMISEGFYPSTIQISNDGFPIILGPDCGSVGGYKKLGWLNTASFTLLGRAIIGSKVRFSKISFEQAEEKDKEFFNFQKYQQACHYMNEDQ